MLNHKKLFLLDIDGTVCKGDQLIDGTKEFLEDIENAGGQFVFITNNATKSVRDYIVKFQNLGVHVNDQNFVTASYATIEYLKRYFSGKLIYVLGTASFIQELRQNEIQVTTDCEDDAIDCILISYDDELTYKKIKDVCKLLSNGDLPYLATNPDYTCPIEFGYVPDCGSICEMLKHAVKKWPYFIGKPETDMIEIALRQNPFSKEETILVGDRLYTDIECGIRAGVDTVLVLSGEATKEDVEHYREDPTYIFDTIAELHKVWKISS